MSSEIQIRVRAVAAALVLSVIALSTEGCASSSSGTRDNLRVVEIRHPWGPSTFAYRKVEPGQTFQMQ